MKNSKNASPDYIPPRNPIVTWLKKHPMARTIGVSIHTLKPYRKLYWQLGIHYERYNSRTIRYNRELIIDWVANRSSPEAHQRAIETYLASLPSNQPNVRSRKPK